jgi:hypothetical protein
MEFMMEFLYFLTSPSYLIYTLALILAIILALVSLIGGELEEDFDIDLDDNPLVDYLGFGRVPVLVSVMCLIAFFGLAGFGLQFIISIIGLSFSWYLSAPVAFIMSATITRYVTKFISKNLPNCETYAVDVADFVGSRAEVTLPAPAGRIGEGKITDSVGTIHYLRIRFSDDVTVGELVNLVNYDKEQRIFSS